MFIADLHIHSKYSRATSGDCDLPHLDLWARKKGIHLVGTGDFTHPKWRQEISEMLSPLGNGFYALKEEYRLPCAVPGAIPPQFVLSSEISTIYKRDNKTRKVHHVILLPDLDAAEDFSHRLEAIGNLHSDGRPILGLDSRELLDILLSCCPESIYIPAHIWTPHFSLFGAFSGFDSIEECYGDLAGHIHAVETGLSSDPLMNRRLSALDGHVLISNSDAHSPQKLGREANLLSCELSFSSLKTALDTGEGFGGTIEFFPEEGKYHMDGHRNCQCRLTPEETIAYQGRCPVCGKKITVGVSHRVEILADRKENALPPLPHPFESLVPLPEIVGECLGVSAASKKAQIAYEDLLQKLGPEFSILREKSIPEIDAAGGPLLAEAISRLRRGQVIRQAGYDGEYGVIRLFENGEKEIFLGQTSLLSMLPPASGPDKKESLLDTAPEETPQELPAPQQNTPNEAQQAAIVSEAKTLLVIAGPGTGKTGTLVNRITHLIEEKGVSPREITAVTFTRQAARGMQERLEQKLGKKALRGITIGTFHAICLSLIEKKPLISRRQALDILRELLQNRKEKMPPAQALALISAEKNLLPAPALPAGLRLQYDEALRERNIRDLDDVMLEALEMPTEKEKRFHHLLVDEFQDINALQRKLVLHWGKGNSLFVIGDPDQSIYGFRGADAGCFDDLMNAYPEAEAIRLSQNYRSAPAIVDCALSVIRNNPGMERMLNAVRPQGAAPRLIQTQDLYTQGALIAREISHLTGGVDMLEAHARDQERAHYAFSDIAVLCRTRRQLEQIESCLRRESIPCLISAREDFWEDETVEALLGFFTALLEPANPAPLDPALRKLFHCPEGLIHQAQQALSCLPDFDAFSSRLASFDGLSPFLTATGIIWPLLPKEKPRKLLDLLIANCGCKGKAVDALKNSALFHGDMPSFLQHISACEEGDFMRSSGGKPSGAVRLMTLHAAKGLEFPVVFLAGVDEGKLPLERPDEICNIEEERRLFFVGITRARDELILTCGDTPSPFLAELPEGIQRETAKKIVYPQQFQQMSLF